MAKPEFDAHSWPETDYEERPWRREGTEIASRRELRSAAGPYRASVPPLIAATPLRLRSAILAEAEDASTELARFDAEFGAITAPFSSILLRTESASSSEVENITSSAKQVALAEIGASTSTNARLVVANGRAMNAAIALSDRLDVDAVIEMHQALLSETDPDIVGRFRDQQVWIGGGSISPHGANFIPPHHERVPELMVDLMTFARRVDLPVLAQTAIAHAQFETIHPFPDGNGRTGRALIQGMLRAGRITRSVTVPVSAGLLADVEEYFDALTAYRDGDAEPIVDAISEAAFRAIRNGRRLVADIERIRDRWDEAVKARSDAAVRRLISVLLRQPVVNNRVVSETLAVSDVTAQAAIDKLHELEILVRAGGGSRNRLWQATEVLDALDAFGARAKRARSG